MNDKENRVDQAIRDRKTSKMLATNPISSELDESEVREVVELAGLAPFHLAVAAEHRHGESENALMPWRFYVVSRKACVALRNHLIENGDKTKVPDMLAAAGVLVQVTWCPDPAEADFVTTEKYGYCPTEGNMEHIAAASAAVQNMLLAATSRGFPSYWSSGGPLRRAPVFSLLGIPDREILLGSVFLFSKNAAQQDVTVKPGKMREKRGEMEDWCRWIDDVGDD